MKTFPEQERVQSHGLMMLMKFASEEQLSQSLAHEGSHAALQAMQHLPKERLVQNYALGFLRALNDKELRQRLAQEEGCIQA
eukprot:138827-Amphidinium_carterae.1